MSEQTIEPVQAVAAIFIHKNDLMPAPAYSRTGGAAAATRTDLAGIEAVQMLY